MPEMLPPQLDANQPGSLVGEPDAAAIALKERHAVLLSAATSANTRRTY